MSGKSRYSSERDYRLWRILDLLFLRHAEIGLQIAFTRVGARITLRETIYLMVEMQEAANIVHNATKKSLIILMNLDAVPVPMMVSWGWSIAEVCA